MKKIDLIIGILFVLAGILIGFKLVSKSPEVGTCKVMEYYPRPNSSSKYIHLGDEVKVIRLDADRVQIWIPQMNILDTLEVDSFYLYFDLK